MLNYDLQQAIPSLDSISGPGSFAFLDNLAVGLPANVPHAGDTGLTIEETRTHFSVRIVPLVLSHAAAQLGHRTSELYCQLALFCGATHTARFLLQIWCIMASPLILNHNIFPGPKAVDPAVTEIITNKEVIAINQDALGKSAVRIDGSATWARLLHRTPMQSNAWSNGEQLEKPLANGDIAVLLFNRLNTTMDITLNFEDVNDTSRRCWGGVRDLWQSKELGPQKDHFVAQAVPPHGCRFLRLSQGAICPPPVPPSCPTTGFISHAGGYWANTDPCDGNFSHGPQCIEDTVNSTSAECAKKCEEAADCVAFNIYTGQPAACYIYHKETKEPFIPSPGCFTCVRRKTDL